jgi:hypothetical protein
MLVTELSVSKGSVDNITDALGYSKMCAHWVPQSLTNSHKTEWQEVWSDLVSHYEADGEHFLSWIVTQDGTRIYHMETTNKKGVTVMASSNCSLKEEVQDYLFSRESHGYWFLGLRRGDFGKHYTTWLQDSLKCVHSNS